MYIQTNKNKIKKKKIKQEKIKIIFEFTMTILALLNAKLKGFMTCNGFRMV